MTGLKSYTSPELTDEEKRQAEDDARKLIAKYGYGNLPKMLAMLVAENAKLCKEINEYRAPLGIEPLRLYKV